MPKNNPYLSFPLFAWLLCSLLVLLSFLAVNKVLTALSVITLPAFAVLVWRKKEPPILFFALAFQWLAVCVKVFEANALGMTVEEMFGEPQIKQAVLFGLSGLVVLALGMRAGMANLKSVSASEIQDEAGRFSIGKIFQGYLIAFGVSFFFRRFVWLAPRFTQILIAVLNFKWVLFFLLAYAVLQRKRKRPLLYAAVVLEVAVGFVGFFSDFKKPLFVLLVAYMTLGYRLTPRHFLKMSLMVFVMAYLGTVWMSVREDYRDYVNTVRTVQQEITVPLRSRFSKMAELYKNLEWTSFREGFEKLVKRVAYVDMFARVIRLVPAVSPHENGRLLAGAIRHVLTPRLFFLEKPTIDDTELTMKYTQMEFGDLRIRRKRPVDFGERPFSYDKYVKNSMKHYTNVASPGSGYFYLRRKIKYQYIAHDKKREFPYKKYVRNSMRHYTNVVSPTYFYLWHKTERRSLYDKYARGPMKESRVRLQDRDWPRKTSLRKPLATSVSMGYMVESYIDFGFWGMLGVVFGLGALWGLIYRYFISRAAVKLFGFAAAVTVLIHVSFFETSLTRLIGGVMMTFIVMAMIQEFFIPHLYRWLSAKPGVSVEASDRCV